MAVGRNRTVEVFNADPEPASSSMIVGILPAHSEDLSIAHSVDGVAIVGLNIDAEVARTGCVGASFIRA